MESVTRLLLDWRGGDEKALEALTPLIYAELRRLAGGYMRRERPDHTLQPTALVHEAYLRMIDQRVEWQSRAHFMGVAAQMMRRILVDYAKERKAAKRGDGALKLSLSDEAVQLPEERLPAFDLSAVDEALDELAKLDPERAKIVELRYFGGLSNEESAEVLGVSPATVQRRWAGARAWLFHELSHKKGD